MALNIPNQPLPPGTVIGTEKNTFDASRLRANLVPAHANNPDTIPSNWNIKETTEEGIIEGRNHLSGSTFIGTREDFNKVIRGELLDDATT